MDGEILEEGKAEELLFGSAVGRPAAVAEILETFLDTLTLRVLQDRSARLSSGGRATPTASKSSDLFCWPSLLLAPPDPNFLKETLRSVPAAESSLQIQTALMLLLDELGWREEGISEFGGGRSLQRPQQADPPTTPQRPVTGGGPGAAGSAHDWTLRLFYFQPLLTVLVRMTFSCFGFKGFLLNFLYFKLIQQPLRVYSNSKSRLKY